MELRSSTVWFEEWRTYIHELERELGRRFGRSPRAPRTGSPVPEARPRRPPTPAGMRVAFLVNDLQLSGGVGVVIQHARRLSAIDGWDVTLVLVREQEGPSWHGYEQLPHLHVRTASEALEERYDVAVATWWETAFTLFELSAERYAYFVQSLEDRFYRHDEAERLGAALTLDLPVAFITEARWIADTLAGAAARRAVLPRAQRDRQGGLRPARASAPADAEARCGSSSRARRAPGSRACHEAIVAAAAMREPHHVTVVTGDREALGDVPPTRSSARSATARWPSRYGAPTWC